MTSISNVNIKKELSPCVSNCQLNENDVCIGCYRSISEITGWRDQSEKQKRAIIVRCSQRKSNR
ncbi:DUF1289 domain-containing protein [Colwelliaceae bacterium BS250]